jgi:hypothetical protein
MTWTSVGEEIMMWRYLEEKIFFLSTSSFNLYYRLLDQASQPFQVDQ